MKDQNELSLQERFTAPTPKLFALIRNIGIMVAALSLAIKNLPADGVPVPTGLLFLADKAYALAGAVAAVVAQFTVDFKAYSEANLLSKISRRR